MLPFTREVYKKQDSEMVVVTKNRAQAYNSTKSHSFIEVEQISKKKKPPIKLLK